MKSNKLRSHVITHKKKLFNTSIILLLMLLTSCVNDKKYSYVETTKEFDIISNSYETTQKDTEVIEAPNDSIAYLQAYEKFCISRDVSDRMIYQGIKYVNIPVSFVLYNAEGNEVNPLIPDDVLSKIKQNVESLNFSDDDQDKEEINTIDSVKIKELSPLFNFKKDEFSPENLTWIKPKSAPKYLQSSKMYCYFMQDNNGVSNFRFKIQYYASDWLFIRKYQFNIDGKAYEFIPNNVETDHNTTIWEWCDEGITTKQDIELIKALASAKQVKIKHVGRQYHDIRTVSKKEVESIKNTLDLFFAMGGKFRR